MHLKLNIHGKPYAIAARTSDGPIEHVFGESAQVGPWIDHDAGLTAGDGYVGTYDGRPVTVARADYARLIELHGLIKGPYSPHD